MPCARPRWSSLASSPICAVGDRKSDVLGVAETCALNLGAQLLNVLSFECTQFSVGRNLHSRARLLVEHQAGAPQLSALPPVRARGGWACAEFRIVVSHDALGLDQDRAEQLARDGQRRLETGVHTRLANQPQTWHKGVEFIAKDGSTDFRTAAAIEAPGGEINTNWVVYQRVVTACVSLPARFAEAARVRGSGGSLGFLRCFPGTFRGSSRPGG